MQMNYWQSNAVLIQFILSGIDVDCVTADRFDHGYASVDEGLS